MVRDRAMVTTADNSNCILSITLAPNQAPRSTPPEHPFVNRQNE